MLLNLSIGFFKSINGGKKYFVLFFVYGGLYFNGMGVMFEGSMLLVFGIVVVIINYRLGLFGELYVIYVLYILLLMRLC